ncbi:hypothetical protein SAMN05421734_10498 [Pelagirhabdus alkalitolerans]|uniref:Uncharacterized protein n=1 Tax=Pelagirhabdus alkalitolerans TaxID=1612202 RepID=A0A1G6IPD9_9BACI|nr:hypothetical protein [Pelagirhabdus alkalitolerans]SDC08291.1 hypothetical protein SAMN05421734_10498 [Pelagirhabdus alkalitolerans]
MNSNVCHLLQTGGVVSCYLSDSSGTPVESGIVCTVDDKREDVKVKTSKGQEVNLQKIWIKKEGFIVVQVTNDSEQCQSIPIPFCLNERVILCAPEGTDIVCKTRDFNCHVSIDCQNGVYRGMTIDLDVCLDVQVSAGVAIEIYGDACHPREILANNDCKDKGSIRPLPRISVNPSSQKRIETMEQNKRTQNCTHVAKVYDWVILKSQKTIRKSAEDAPFICDRCALHFFVPAVLVCERTISGTLECNGERVEGASIQFSSTPDIVTFSPDPAVTDENGHLTTVVTVPPGTDTTNIEITASSTINGDLVSTTLPTIVLCLAEPCILTLFGSETMTCDDVVSGRVWCNNTFVPGVEVELTANPPIVSFDPNPTITDGMGDYFANVSIPDGTPPTDVEITATATVNGELLTETITVNVSCESECELTLNADAFITCEGEITGVLTCDGAPVEGQQVDFSIFPSVGQFNPNPVMTLADGSFSTTLTIPEETPHLSTVVTATTIVGGQSVGRHINVHVECLPVVECPCKFRIGISGNAAPATVDVVSVGVPSTLTGTINVTAVQCFSASAMCNPAVDNFNVSFGSGGNTINFITGRRIEIECDGNTFARVRGMARVTGNVLPGGIYEVTITCDIGTGGLATWTVNATDFSGNSFSTSFMAQINPATFIGDCQDVP